MGEKGEVIELKNNLAIIKMIRTEACSKCGACKNGMAKNEMIIEAKNLCEADIGDWVEIDLQSQDFLKAVGIMYGIPLILLIFGFVLGYVTLSYTPYKSYSEIISFFVGIIFMLFSYIWIRKNESNWKKQNFSPVAVKKV